ncbi:MAG: acyl-CoA dehydrogenase family protein [Actinomycetota bacterium]
MLDERWPEDVAELSAGLRSLLEKACGTEVVRAAESSDDGRNPALEEKLDAFGLWDLPRNAAMLAAASWEIGRALAPVPFAECGTVLGVLGLRDTSYGLEGTVPVRPSKTVISRGDAVLLADVVAPGRRTSAGDLLAEAPTEGSVIGQGDAARRMKALARLLHAARLTGAAERMLEAGVEHVKRRTQFGKPIGSFQAVAHRLADAAIALDGATLLIRKTAWVSAQGGEEVPSQTFAPMVWAKAVDAGRLVAAAVHQVMGGYGFTLEEDTQLYGRRIRSWTMRLPSPAPDLAMLARMVLDPEHRDAIAHLWQSDEGIPLPRWATETDGGTR